MSGHLPVNVQHPMSCTSSINISFTTELVDSSIRNSYLRKACGPDDLSAERLTNAHPCIAVIWANTFKLIGAHHYVPDTFGIGTIIPFIKDKSRNLNDPENYCTITLIPIVCKVFEHCILSICEHLLFVDQLQLGFKRGIGCTEAIFVHRTTIDYFIDKGGSVYVAALDIPQVFDSVKHDKMFLSLSLRGIPNALIDNLRIWYSKLLVKMR
jgi:Reverse transcriptase (RNA-dependent DNA polymerase)